MVRHPFAVLDEQVSSSDDDWLLATYMGNVGKKNRRGK